MPDYLATHSGWIILNGNYSVIISYQFVVYHEPMLVAHNRD